MPVVLGDTERDADRFRFTLADDVAVVETAQKLDSYLDAHPGANDALTNAGSSGDAEGAVRAYFSAHPGEFMDLKNIAHPLTSLRGQCGMSVTPGQLAALFDALS